MEELSFLPEFSPYPRFNHYSGRVENQEEVIGILNKLDKRPYEAGTNGWREQKQQNKQTFFGLMHYSIRRNMLVDKDKIKDKISKRWTSLLVPLPALFLLVIPTALYKGIMLLPVILYLRQHLPRHSGEPLYEDLRWLFLHPPHIPGWAIAGLGFLLFLIALTTMLKNRGRLLTSGMYGKIRHPQYLGFIVMAWGITAVSWKYYHRLALPSGVLGYFPHPWVVVSLAYVGLAFLEERYLLKKHPEEYKEYKQKVPFLFPVPHPRKIPQPIFDLGIIILFSFVLQEIYPRIIQIFI